jgi:hypothetical protein
VERDAGRSAKALAERLGARLKPSHYTDPETALDHDDHAETADHAKKSRLCGFSVFCVDRP